MNAPVPKVSIGLPVYNGEKYLRAALDSILRQDYTDFELIISDNASSDATEMICRDYAAKDPRIRYSRNTTNIGASANFNRTFALARGEFFKWAAHDDCHLPRFLSRCVEILNRAPSDVVLVAPQIGVIDEMGHSLSASTERLHLAELQAHERIGRLLREVKWAGAQFGLMRTVALKQTRLIDRFHACDYVLLFELAMLGQIWEIPEVLFQRRWHAQVSTQIHNTEAEFSAWFDPSYRPRLRDRLITTRMRVGLECLRSVSRILEDRRERLRCYSTILNAWYFANRRQFISEYAAGFTRMLRKRVSTS